MKIVAPASSLKDIEEYNKLGVDEIYIGLRNEKNDWKIINKRSEKNANFKNLEEIRKIKTDAEISFVINNSFFDDSRLKIVKKQIIDTKNYVNNYIISDPSLIKIVKKYAPNKNIILSVIGANFNSESIKFFTKKGIKKIILPRHLTMTEFKKIVEKNKQTEFEVLIMNQYCRNVDGFCSRCHIPENGIYQMTCDIPFNSKLIKLNDNISNDKLNLAQKNIANISKFNRICGLCFIKDFQKIGINHLKLVGRNHNTKWKVDDVKMVKEAIENLETNKTKFIKKCKTIFKNRKGRDCNNNCYY